MRPAASDDEREVRELLAAAERPVDVPSFVSIRRRQTSTTLATVALVAGVVVVASAALGAALRGIRESASAVVISASPTSIAGGLSSPSATPQPTPAAPLSVRYGVIVDADPPYLRSETDPQRIAQLGSAPFNGAVSPDGRRVAYWQSSNGAPRVLSVLDLAAPAPPRALLTLPDIEVASTSTGGGVIWSTDGTGLLIAVNSRDVVQQPVVDMPYLYATLRQVDVDTASVREIVRKDRSFPFFPIAWDRPRGVSAAVEWGSGGYATRYVAVRDDGSVQATDLSGATLPRFVRSAPDGSRVMMLDFQGSSAIISIWPLTDPTQRITLWPEVGERVVGAIWRSAQEIVVSVGRMADASVAERLEVWTLDGQRRVVLQTQHRLDAVRPDGTAAITTAGVVDLATGAVARMPGDPGAVAASVSLPQTLPP